jgi:uncharacterized membrane protein YhaH (DUF805 family)
MNKRQKALRSTYYIMATVLTIISILQFYVIFTHFKNMPNSFIIIILFLITAIMFAIAAVIYFMKAHNLKSNTN